jgi:hypothetical protein
LLAFLGISGLSEVYHAEGTMDRVLFYKYVRRYISSGKAMKYPFKHSVWILDGAAIHLDANIAACLHDAGIRWIFLPAYCPFFNPIEYVFGVMKREFKRKYGGKGTELETLLTVLGSMTTKDMSSIFAHCGYSVDGTFNPLTNLSER